MNIPLRILINTDSWRAILADIGLGMRHASRDTLALLGLTMLLGSGFLLSQTQLRVRLETQAYNWLADRANARLMPHSLLAFGGNVEDQPTDVLLDLAEPDASERATAVDPATLSRQQAAVVKWISQRYAVAQEPVGRLAQEAWAVGKKVGIDPTLILAVMAIESRYNPFAQSHVGAQGLMQVMTQIHKDKYQNFGGKQAAFDPVTNLRVGVQVLKDCIRAAGSVEMGLKYYVGAANLAHDSGYGAKVLAEQAYLKQVMAGQKVATTVTWPKFNETQVAQLAKPDDASSNPEPALAPAVDAPVVPTVSTANKPATKNTVVQPPADAASAPTFTHDGAQIAMAN